MVTGRNLSKKAISIMCVIAMLLQVFSGYSGLLVSASDTVKSDFQQAIEGVEYKSVYADAETEELALDTAKTKVQEVISSRTDENEKTATFVISEGKRTATAKGGSYTFKVTVTLKDNTSFTTDAISMAIAARPEPVKHVFDSAEKLDTQYLYTGGNGNIQQTFADEIATGGKAYLKITAGGGNQGVDQISYLYFANGLDLDAYPYIKISYRHEREKTGSVWEYAQLYVKRNSLTDYESYEFYPYNKNDNSDNGQWNEVILDMKKLSAAYANTRDDENIKATSTSHCWSGMCSELRMDFTNNDTFEREVDIEYIAFFGSKEEAEAYPVELGSLKSVLENTEYTAEYAEAENVATVTAVAEKQVREVIDQWGKANGTSATFTIGDKAELKRYVSGGTFNFDGTVTMEDGSSFSVDLSLTIAARPEPVQIVLNSQATLDKVYVADNNKNSVTKEFVDNRETGGKAYMKTVVSGTTEKNIDLIGYLTFSKFSEIGSLNLDAYPYMKISYCHSREATSGWETMVIYNNSDAYTGLNRYRCYPYNTNNNNDNGVWNEVIYNMKAVTADYKNDPEMQQLEHETTDKDWTGICSEVRIDLTESQKHSREVDIEYIAFFASEEQAKAYPGVPDDTVDQSKELLEGKKFSCESAKALTQADAGNELASQLQALKLPAAYTLENEVYVAPTINTAGSYTAELTFTSTKEVVKVTLHIEKTPIVPVVWTFDNQSILSQFTGTNATTTYENGYVKMTTTRTSYDDGFFLQGSPVENEKFNLSNLPYVKLKYKISGAQNAPLQLFYWLDNGHYYYREFYGNDPAYDGDSVTVIANLSVLEAGKEAVWIQNHTDGTSKTLSFANSGADAGAVICDGTVTQLRFNLARQALDRTAEVEYIGFFPTYEAAAGYTGEAEQRLNKAENYLSENQLEMRWASGSTQEKAIEGAKKAVEEAGVGCVEIKNVVYEQSTTETEGSIQCTAVLKSADKSKEVSVTIKIGKKPSEPIVWRFNDKEFLDKLTYANMRAAIEDNVAKMVSTNPVHDDGFYFIVNLPEDTEQFYLEDYSYIRMKYKREGLAPAQLYFYSDALYGNPNLGSMGYGTKDGDWYTSIIDTSVNNFTDTMITSYNHNTKETEEFVKYAANGYNKYAWEGLSTAFRFNFGRRANLDRTLYLEYIAFFPTLEEAQNYDEENERLKSNAQVALKTYSGSEVSYYEGYNDQAAKETADDLISALVGDEVQVKIHEKSYTAPVMNQTNGKFVFYAEICNAEETVLYTTPEYTITVSNEVDTEPVIFTFSNPNFVKRVEGTSPTAKNHQMMSLTGTDKTSFTLKLKKTEKFHLAGHSYVALKTAADSTESVIQLNGTDYSIGSVLGNNQATQLVLDLTTGDIYKDGVKTNISITDDIVFAKLQTLGMQFTDSDVNVYYIGFFADLGSALNYDGSSDLLQTAADEIQALDLKCAYADAQTRKEAFDYVQKKLKNVLQTIGSEIEVVSADCSAYTGATTEAAGTITVKAMIAVGEQKDKHYTEVELVAQIGKKPSEPVVYQFDEEMVKTLVAGANVQLSLVDGVLHMDTKNESMEDGFYFTMYPNKLGGNFYLQDYPYVKIKYRFHSYGESTGTAQLYFFNDEATGSRGYSLGSIAQNDIWCSAVLDMKDNTITLSNLEQDALLGSSNMTGTTAFHGTTDNFRVGMGRYITCRRHAEIAYIAFFADRESAEAYEKDYAYSGYEFNGAEYTSVKNDLSAEPATIETAVKITKKEKMTILSNTTYSLKVTADGNVQFVVGTNVVLESTGLSINDGKRHQIAVTVSGQEAALYVDGVSKAAKSVSNVRLSKTVPGVVKGYSGIVYYVRLFSNVQSAADLEANAFNSSYKKNVLAGWFMDEVTAKSEVADVCGTNPMMLQDNYDYEGHEFLGNDYIQTEKELSAEPKTFEFWMKGAKSMATGTYTILSNKTNGSSQYTAIELVNGQLRMIYNGQSLFVTEGQMFADDAWKHIAITLGETTVLYINGKQAATGTARTAGNDACKPYYIGAGLESEKTPYVGKLSDIRIWNDVRTPQEISDCMQEYLTTIPEEVLAAWKLDTQTYLEYTDDSSNQNTGKLFSSGWYKLEQITGDYTLGAIGDTQSYMQTTPSLMLDLFDKLSDKIDEFNMKYLFHLGDVTQNDTLMEWQYAREAFDHIEGKMPYSIILGNHDYPSPSSGTGAEFREGSKFNTVFPLSNFENQTLSTLGGAFEENDPTNIYSFFNVGDTEYIVFSLEYGPRDEVLEWAGKVLDRYPNKSAIILTHAYFAYGGYDNSWGALITDNSIYDSSGSDFDTANGGQKIWDKFLSKHANISLLLCGHSQNPFIVSRETEGDYGNNVVQMMADHSAVVTSFPSKEGLMTILSFDEATGKMHTYWYSPLYDAYYSTANEVTFDMSDNLVKGDKEEYYEVYEDISEFRSADAYTYPKAKQFGYVFAGWYDVDTEKPIAETVRSGKAKAKFVDAEVLTVKAQLGVAETESGAAFPETSADIRFVTTVNNEMYRDIAFMISTEKADGSYTTPKSTLKETDPNRKKVYSSLYYVGKNSGETMQYSPNVFSQHSMYFKTFTLKGIPKESYDTNIKVTPYWVTLDGTTVCGRTRLICVNDFRN